MDLLYVGESSKGNLFFKSRANWWSCSKETWERHKKEIEVVGDVRDGIFDAPLDIFYRDFVKLTGMTLEKARDSNFYISYVVQPDFSDVSGLAIFNDRIIGVVNKNPAVVTIPQEIYDDIKNSIEKGVKMKDDMKIEMEAGSNIQLDHIKEIMKENIPDLLAENQRLKAQLDREIHINRKMKKALEIYANTEPIEIMQQRWNGEPTTIGKTMLDIRKPAQKTLKEIEEME